MAIKGAFGAGFVQGFGESMKKNAEKRFDQQQRYVDNMMENARRLAPKYMQDKATADNAVELMNEFQTRYGVSNEEFIALYQTHDINEVYKTIQSAEAGLRPNEQLNVRSQILGALDIPKGTKLPDGMSAEDAVRSMVLGYSQNLNSKPGDTSESHKNNSWAKAVSNVLALNPRASAEEQISAMKVAGVPVQQILQYQAMQGDKYKPLQGVTRSGIINFDDGYSDGDYDSTYGTYASTFRQTFAQTDDLSKLDSVSMEEAMTKLGVSNEAELAEKIKSGGVSMAELELSLANVGVGKTSRDSSMRKIAAEVNTAQQFNNMTAAIKSGLAVDLIRESINKHGTLTDDYIAKILQNQPMKQEPAAAAAPAAAPVIAEPSAAAAKQTAEVLGKPSLADMQAGRFDREVLPQQPIDPSLTNAGIVSGLVGGDGTSDTAPSVSASEDPSVTRDAVAQEINKHTPKDIFGISVADIIDKVPSLADLDFKLPVMPTEEESMDALDRLPSHLETLGSQAEEAWSEFKVAVDNYSYEMPEVPLGQRQLTQPINALQFMIAGAVKDAFGDAAQTEEDVKAFTEIAERGFDTEANQGLISYIRAAQRRAFKPMPEDKAEKAIKTANAIGKVDLGDLSGAPGFRSEDRPLTDIIMDQRTIEREPELLSYEVWKDMSKAERKSVGLDLPLVSIQNRVRSGSIPLPRGKSLPTPLRMKQERYLAASTESGTTPRVPADEAIMTRPTKQDLTSPTTESSISVERSTGPSKSLADLRTTFNRIHGKKSKASKQLEKVLQEAQSGTPIQYTDVNQLLRITRSLPKTKTRDELAEKLYDLAQGLR